MLTLVSITPQFVNERRIDASRSFAEALAAEEGASGDVIIDTILERDEVRISAQSRHNLGGAISGASADGHDRHLGARGCGGGRALDLRTRRRPVQAVRVHLSESAGAISPFKR